MSTATSIWTPLRQPAFRGLWMSGGVYFLGNAMHTMAVSWLMVDITDSPFLAALVQTAAFLPMFLLSLPAGVLADITDRRRLILGALTVYTASAVLLTVLAAVGRAGPARLLLFSFVMGACTALQSPAWNSAVSDTIAREELPQAITMIAMAFNGARAVGPALAGVVFAVAGSSAVFSSAVWGAISGVAGLPVTLRAAAVGMVASVLLARPFPLRMGAESEVTHATPWLDLFIAEEPEPQAGPVAVEIAYRIQPADAARFLDIAEGLRVPRQRDGATFWRIYRDLGDPTRYLERFIVTSWADYLRQRARATVADQEIEACVRAFQAEGVPIAMQHYIAER